VSFAALEELVPLAFPEVNGEDDWRLYYITDIRNLHESLSRVSDDASLKEYVELYNRPTLLIYFANKTPTHSPVQSSVHQRDYHSQSSGNSNDRNKNAHDYWAELIRNRDTKKCVDTGEEYCFGKKNLQAAHLFGLNISKKAEREAAEIPNVYDPRSRWHYAV
jgi:hypothetical protein